jgi:SAM-dependent methyltransferase
MSTLSDARPLAPGTILQFLYVNERLRRRAPGRFVEVGAGEGELSHVLLEAGWRGRAYDLNHEALAHAATRNAGFVDSGRLELVEGDWLTMPFEPCTTDLVVAAMVLEHLPDKDVIRFLDRAAESLTASGELVLIVPGSPAHWGIEDDVAGHLRRYTRESLVDVLSSSGWSVEHLASLTFPLSNMLLWLSNRLVSRYEAQRLALGQGERTIASGSRSVPWKTSFPRGARLLLNKATLYPFHLIQKAMRRTESGLVLYCEARPSDARSARPSAS